MSALVNVRDDIKMKTKTSVTLSHTTLAGVERAGRVGESRSATIERLLRDRLDDDVRRLRRLRDVAQIDKHAHALNAEAADALAYQREV